MAKYTLSIKNHPCLLGGNSGDITFSSLQKLEIFVGEKDIQCDHIKKITRISKIEGTITTYTVPEIIPISTVRVVLKEIDRVDDLTL